MQSRSTYIGIDKDKFGGMSDIGKIIRDAWAFGLIPETETCAGWQLSQLEALWHQVNEHWQKYNFRVSAMPTQLQQHYLQIQQHAVAKARQAGWNGEQELGDD